MTAAAPLRSCRVCRSKMPKSQLTRWVAGPQGLEPDPLQGQPGRGYYSCSTACAEKLKLNRPKRQKLT
jgi:predicted RNA-binding protein YlxR (DUF448 family)